MQPRGKPVGVHQVLGEAEQAAVRQAVVDHRPCNVGLSGQLWTRRLVGELIAELYRVRLTEPGVGKHLRRWGLSFQRPDKRAVEQDPEAVRRWHEETWPAIRAKAKKDGGEILFADQVARTREHDLRARTVRDRSPPPPSGVTPAPFAGPGGTRWSVQGLFRIPAPSGPVAARRQRSPRMREGVYPGH
ncbi:winged helix-turn-helix domain-containing protein [Streptomyces sp. NBC_01367]|uniref:winged helix-turn-helix domain-containing protein n=1 Tax=Streptomyces sp. NBC_01367 TaxID=2903841 RepID=UPI00324B2BBF